MIHWLCSNNLQVPLHMNPFTLGTLNTFEYTTCGMVSYLSRIVLKSYSSKMSKYFFPTLQHFTTLHHKIV